MNNDWILVNEKLPNNEENVLITFVNEVGTHIGESLYRNSKFFYTAETDTGYYEEIYSCVIAWMPLPTPYQSEKINKRKIKFKNGEIECFWEKGKRNPCKCGSNLFHEEYSGTHIYGVCNACDMDIYEFKFDKEYIQKSEWKDKE